MQKLKKILYEKEIEKNPNNNNNNNSDDYLRLAGSNNNIISNYSNSNDEITTINRNDKKEIDDKNNLEIDAVDGVEFTPPPPPTQITDTPEQQSSTLTNFTATILLNVYSNLLASICYKIHKNPDKINEFKFSDDELNELANLFAQAYPSISMSPKTMFYITLLTITGTKIYTAYNEKNSTKK